LIKIATNTRGYTRVQDRKAAITLLAKKTKMNFFVCYRDVAAQYALMYGHAGWVAEGDIYVSRT